MYENFIELSVLLGIYLSSMVLITCYKKDTSISNFTWGGGVLIVALYSFFRMSNLLLQQMLVTVMVVVWAIRIIAHIYIRYTGKDPRYLTWRWQGIKALFINTVWIFGQTIMIVIMSYPIVLINMYNNLHSISSLDIVGIVIWLCGYYWESVSDYQLFNFMRNPNNKGHVLQSGLWHYSRHPNYFGESMMWVGIYFLALSIPNGWTAIITPITIITLLVYVTGIPLLENAMADNPEYQQYKQNTSKFFPWFTK